MNYISMSYVGAYIHYENLSRAEEQEFETSIVSNEVKACKNPMIARFPETPHKELFPTALFERIFNTAQLPKAITEAMIYALGYHKGHNLNVSKENISNLEASQSNAYSFSMYILNRDINRDEQIKEEFTRCLNSIQPTAIGDRRVYLLPSQGPNQGISHFTIEPKIDDFSFSWRDDFKSLQKDYC